MAKHTKETLPHQPGRKASPVGGFPSAAELVSEVGHDSDRYAPPIPTRIPAQADDMQTLEQKVNYEKPGRGTRGSQVRRGK
jgi:hypothetical protein